MKKLKIHLKVLIIFFMLFSLIGVLFVKGNEHYEIQRNYEEIGIFDYISNIKGYNITNGYLDITESDPQLVFEFDEYNPEGIYAFSINLSEKIDLSNVEVFLGYKNAEFSSEDLKSLGEGKTNVIEIVSVLPFKALRIDIDSKVTVENVGISDSLEVKKESNALYYVIVIFLSLFISIILSYIDRVNKFVEFIWNYLLNLLKGVKNNKFNIIFVTILVVFELFISCAIEEVISAQKEYLNRQRIIVMFVIMLILTITYVYRKYIFSNLHKYVFVIIMILGITHTIVSPPVAGISWDDEIHYGRTVYLSWLSSGHLSAADEELIERYNSTITTKSEYTSEGRNKTVKEIENINEKYDKPLLVDNEDYDVNLQYIAYIPTALALGCARGIGLNYAGSYIFGKMINVFSYALIISLAIWIIKGKGKMLISVLALLPTSIFLASSYSYDWWVIGFCILAYSYFISKLQKKEAFTNMQFVGLMLMMLIALLPKAIYFPIVLPMMLLKKERYKDALFCRGLVIITMLILVATFIFPILFATATGDTRGGSDVDSMKQVAFILNHPLKYTKILFGFLTGYLSLNNADGYTTMMGYYGTAEHFAVCLVIVAMTVVLDNDSKNYLKDKNYIFVKAITVVCCFVAIVLASTALYVSFTAVGYETILGCQPRYILPLLFPALYCLSDFEITVKEKTKNTFIALSICVMAFVFLNGIFTLCGIYY